MACTFDLDQNDIPGTNPIDPASLVTSNVPANLTVVNNLDGTVTVSSTIPGTYVFNYDIADTFGNRSNTTTVTITIDPPPVPSPPAPSGINVSGLNDAGTNIPFPAGITTGCDLFMVTGDIGGHSVSSEWTQLDSVSNGTTTSQLLHRQVDGTETVWSFLTGTDVNWSIVEFCDVDTFVLDPTLYLTEPYTLNQPVSAPNDRPWVALMASGNDGGSAANGYARITGAQDFRKEAAITRAPPGSSFFYRTLDLGETISNSLANGCTDLVADASSVGVILERMLVLYGSVTGADPDLDVTVQTSVPSYIGGCGWANGATPSNIIAVVPGPAPNTTGDPNLGTYQVGDFVIGVDTSSSSVVLTPNGYASGPYPNTFAGYKSWYGFPDDPSVSFEPFYAGSQAGIIRAYRGVNVKRPVSDAQVSIGSGTGVTFPNVEAVAGDIIVLLVAANGTVGGLTLTNPPGAVNRLGVNQWPGRAYAFDYIATVTGTNVIPGFTMNQAASSWEAYAFVLKGA